MAVIRLVRHAEPAAGWGEDADPGLSALGREQARALADALAPLGPAPILTSPLRRCRETAEPLCALWGVRPAVEPAIAEILHPAGVADRAGWLAGVLTQRWGETDAALQAWARAAAGALAALTCDVVAFSHFVAINAAVGAAAGDDRVCVFRPAHASVTVLEADGGRLIVRTLGREAAARPA